MTTKTSQSFLRLRLSVYGLSFLITLGYLGWVAKKTVGLNIFQKSFWLQSDQAPNLTDFSAFGESLGVVTAIFTIAAFVLLVETLLIQLREFSNAAKIMGETSKSQRNLAEISRISAQIAWCSEQHRSASNLAIALRRGQIEIDSEGKELPEDRKIVLLSLTQSHISAAIEKVEILNKQLEHLADKEILNASPPKDELNDHRDGNESV